MSSITVRQLAFSYTSSLPILKDITFEAEDGELIALLGPNGAGKSTLLRCMLGLLKPGGGDVLINNVSIKGKGPAGLAKEIAYVPQQHDPAFNFTVLDMVLMGAAARLGRFSTPGKKERTLALSCMDKLSISHLRDRGFAKISGGEQQLAYLARALAQQTKIILMDEPTANLDYGNKHRVLAQIKVLTKEGYTILQSTHSPNQAFMFADRVLALHEGMLLANGGPRQALTSDLLFKLYGVPVKIENRADGTFYCAPQN